MFWLKVCRKGALKSILREVSLEQVHQLKETRRKCFSLRDLQWTSYGVNYHNTQEHDSVLSVCSNLIKFLATTAAGHNYTQAELT